MEIETKDALITPTGSDGDFPGSFEVVLSAPTLDRDGDTLLPHEWKQPLPAKINFDADHAMSVAGTVGSGPPSIDAAGRLIVHGTYSSLPRAQEVRTLVKEGHIDSVSVAFMSVPSEMKDGKPQKIRELLNGSFVSVPSNREAVVLASKAFEAKAGARNSKTDAEMIQAIHDHATTLGAICAAKSVTSDDADVKDVAPETPVVASEEDVSQPELSTEESEAARSAELDPPPDEGARSTEAVTPADEDAEMQTRAARYSAIHRYITTPERG